MRNKYANIFALLYEFLSIFSLIVSNSYFIWHFFSSRKSYYMKTWTQSRFEFFRISITANCLCKDKKIARLCRTRQLSIVLWEGDSNSRPHGLCRLRTIKYRPKEREPCAQRAKYENLNILRFGFFYFETFGVEKNINKRICVTGNNPFSCKLPISLRKISRVFWEKIGLLIIFIQRTSIF